MSRKQANTTTTDYELCIVLEDKRKVMKLLLVTESKKLIKTYCKILKIYTLNSKME